LVAAGAPLASVIISTILSYIWKSPTISVVSIFSIGNLNQFPSKNKRSLFVASSVNIFFLKYGFTFCKNTDWHPPQGSEPSFSEHAHLQRLLRGSGDQNRDHDRHLVLNCKTDFHETALQRCEFVILISKCMKVQLADGDLLFRKKIKKNAGRDCSGQDFRIHQQLPG
jgi:hypothetical protein